MTTLRPVTAEPTAADAELLELEVFVHCWLSPRGAGELRRFLADRAADEVAEQVGRRALGDRDWAEVRRLCWWVDVVDSTAAHKSRTW